MRSDFDRYEVYDEIFDSDGLGVENLNGNTPVDLDIVEMRDEEDNPSEILEAWNEDRREGWRVFEYEPRLRDRFLNRFRIGEAEGYILQFRTEAELGDAAKADKTWYFMQGLMPKDNLGNLGEILNRYDFEIEYSLDDSDFKLVE